MKLFIRIVLGLFVLVILVIGSGVLYLRYGFPNEIPVHAIQVPKGDTALIARGKYLTHYVTPCFVCHSPRDHHKFSEPFLEDSLGAGKLGFGKMEEFPGQLYFHNITPYHLGDWSDGELYRVLTSGVRKNGEPVFPLMPYEAIGRMDSMDVISIIAYLRTLKPINKPSGESEVDFPINLFVRMGPKRPEPIPLATQNTIEDRGHYLANIGGCRICHTPIDDKNQLLPGQDYSGGRLFILGDGARVTSANITPEQETGIGYWSEDAFVARFRSYANVASMPNLAHGDRQTSMPWTGYAHMKDEDLRAIYRYLKTVKPIRNDKENTFEPARAQASM